MTDDLADLLGGACDPDPVPYSGEASDNAALTKATIVHRPVHSSLGASGAERWMNCPGSVELLKHMAMPETDDPSYRTEGVACHAAAAHALVVAAQPDAWELIGLKFGDKGKEVEITSDMATAIQTYLDFTRPLVALADKSGARVMVEYPISSPAHKDFYGTCDFATVLPSSELEDLPGTIRALMHDEETLVVVDYKNGAGIQVEVEDNPQLKYYAYGVLQEFPECYRVRMAIVQPNGFHEDGPVRQWEMYARDLRAWVEEKLVPAMVRTEFDHTLDPGKWCRFCPAKLACPVLTGLFKAAATANPAEIVNYSDESLGRSYEYREAVKFYLKALEDEAFARAMKGRTITGTKLVHKKADRVWKPEAEPLFKSRFPDDCMTAPKLKSPAEMEKVPGAAALVKEYAYKPESGLTLAPESDRRGAVKVTTASETFAGAVRNLATGSTDDFPDLPEGLKR